MSGLMNLLNSTMGQQIVKGLSDQTGTGREQATEVLGMALPLLIGAMKKNARNPDGAQALMNALNSKHDGGILDDLSSFFGGGVEDSVMRDGSGILGHVLGNNQGRVENELSRRSGLDPNTIAQIMKVVAPLALAYLSREIKTGKHSGASDLNGILGSMLGGQPPQNRDMITALIDADGDGSVLDDVAEMVMGTPQKRSGIGGFFKGLFGG